MPCRDWDDTADAHVQQWGVHGPALTAAEPCWRDQVEFSRRRASKKKSIGEIWTEWKMPGREGRWPDLFLPVVGSWAGEAR